MPSHPTLWHRRLVCGLILTACVTAAAVAQAPKGIARRWEASLPVTEYSQVNLHTGRVLTTVPLVNWTGRGPSIDLRLYNNQTSAWGPPGLILGDMNGDGLV